MCYAQMTAIGCLETPVTQYPVTERHTPERKPHLHRCESPNNSRVVLFYTVCLGQRCQPFIHAGNPTNENGYGPEKYDSEERNGSTEKLLSNKSICKELITESALL
jgi:hypothetical protein